jgi:prepilin-type N-terminal cleavage/methylation domain-containing protein
VSSARLRPSGQRRGQRGFTLIELMVALAISSIMVMMVLSVFSRMSTAYRRQQQVASLQGVLSAAQNMLAQDARQAGFQLADGFTMAGGSLLRPVQIVNSSAASDEIYFYSADAAVQARVLSPASSIAAASVDIDTSSVPNPFVNGELVVIVNTSTTTAQVTGEVNARVIPKFAACLVRISVVGPAQINLSQTLPWGSANNEHCNDVRTGHANNQQTMVYRFRGRGYRLDATRAALGVLQLSTSGGLIANDWQDQGIGFADLQVAARMFRETLWTDLDTDGSAQYNWISGNDLTAFTSATPITPASAFYRLTRLTISVSARTDRVVDGVGTAATPAFIVPARASYNNLGDRASVVLNPSDRVYRYTSNRIDLRNTGAGL